MSEKIVVESDSNLIKAVAILSVTVLEAIALFKGIDGTLFSLVIAGICGLAGYHIGKKTK